MITLKLEITMEELDPESIRSILESSFGVGTIEKATVELDETVKEINVKNWA